MDEKTERLRDIFLAVADEDTVTEHQSAARGSLAGRSADEAALTEVVAAMRDRYDFATDLDDSALVTIVRGYYAGRSDAAIARDVGDVSASTVRRGRLDLHLVADRDLDPPFDLDDLRRLRTETDSTGEIAGALAVSPSTVRRYLHAIDAQARRRLVGDRYREEFDRLLGDGALAGGLTAAIRETGLREATEDTETNVSF